MKRKKGNPPLWSVPRITDPRYPGLTVRISELRSGGPLYAIHRNDGRQRMASLKCSRKDLGRTGKEQREQARALALNVIEELAAPSTDSGDEVETPEVLTLGALADLYEKHGLHGVGVSYAQTQVRKVRRFATFLGPDRPVVSLCRSDIKKFAAHRAKDGVSINTVAGDLKGLRIALNFAQEHRRADGRPLLASNPLQRVRLPREEPRRPWATVGRYEKLKAVACKLPPAFECVLDLAWATGHRVGALLRLRWQDVDLESTQTCPFGSVRWYAGLPTDTKKKDETVPINPIARKALDKWREECPGIASAWVFTAPRDSTRALGHHMVVRWLKQAEELAGLEHLDGGGFHQFRRGWGTARKHLSLVDVAAGGGWQRTETLQQCYQHADPASILKVVLADG